MPLYSNHSANITGTEKQGHRGARALQNYFLSIFLFTILFLFLFCFGGYQTCASKSNVSIFRA